MAVQERQDNTNTPLILSDESDVENGTIMQNQGRITPLVYGTVLAQVAATRDWVPFNDVTGVDGTGVPRGIYLGDEIAAADLVDEDYEDVPILVGNARVNEELVVWDDDILGPNTVVAPATVEARTARRALEESVNIRLEATTDATAHEN